MNWDYYRLMLMKKSQFIVKKQAREKICGV